MRRAWESPLGEGNRLVLAARQAWHYNKTSYNETRSANALVGAAGR